MTNVLRMSTFDLVMSTSSQNLGDLIFGQTRGRVLALLYGHDDHAFFVREIAREVETSAGAVQRELGALAHFGLIQRSNSGRQVYYKANPNHPVFPDLKSLVSKTVGIFETLRTALQPIAPRVTLAFVYGSIARSQETSGSDVDLMIVGSVTLDEVLAALESAERTIRRPINPTVYSQDELKSKLSEGNHFLRAVLRGEKVVLIGAPDEFGKMG